MIPRTEVGDGDGGDLQTILVDVEVRRKEQPVMHRHCSEMMCQTVGYVVLGRQIAKRVRDHRRTAVDVQQVQSVQREDRTRRFLEDMT